MKRFAALAAAHKRRVELETAFRISSAPLTLRATDFLTGSSAPSFARVAGSNGELVADVEQHLGENYEAFEVRAAEIALGHGARRLVFGGIPTVIPDEIIPVLPGARNDRVALVDHCLHVDQIRALRLIKQCRFTVLRNGRRWGKTRLLEALISDAVMMGREVGYFAPIYALGRRHEPYLRRFDCADSARSQGFGARRFDAVRHR
jgi:hypothetical protein